ncbi:alpha-1A adrenergic receptor-like [Acropora palmata]|uniref:alpha-1A adrenergic receptor-like n=1 Tax=Acropora palmata TaxID=6131 RepID=UPI003DA146EF
MDNETSLNDNTSHALTSGSTNQAIHISTNDMNIVAAVFVALQIVVALSGNFIVIASFCTFRDLRTKCNFFIISLAISDVLVASIAMPFWLLVQLSNNVWIYSKELKAFWDCMDILCGTASIMNLTAVSFDRQLAITSPFAYPKMLTTRRVLVVIGFVWLYAATISSSRFLDWQFPNYLWFVPTVSFFLPLLIMLVMYTRIYLVARYHARRIGRNYATDIKAAKTIAVVIGGFVICWLPFFVVVLSVANRTPTHVTFFNVAKWLEYLNSCLNPVIYTCSNRTYRSAFKKLFRRCREKIRREDSDALAGVSTWKTVAETHAITHREASSDQSGLITPNGKAIEDSINENVPLKDKHCEI